MRSELLAFKQALSMVLALSIVGPACLVVALIAMRIDAPGTMMFMFIVGALLCVLNAGLIIDLRSGLKELLWTAPPPRRATGPVTPPRSLDPLLDEGVVL